MGDIRRFATLHTKIKSMEGVLLSSQAYQQLIDFNEPDEIIDYLKTTDAYREVFAQAGAEVSDIESVERLLKEDTLQKFERLGHYFTDAYKKFYKLLFMRFEIEDIKLFLRTFLRQESVAFLVAHVHQTKYHRLDLEKLSKVSSLEEFVDRLQGTPYHKLLKYYLEEDPEKMMFYMEMALDHYYFKSLHKQLAEFSDEDRKLMHEAIGKNIDIQNIQWIYRGLKYYGLSPEELLNYTLNLGYHLNYKILKEFCYIKDMDVLVQKIKETKYGDLFVVGGHGEIFFELNMERFLLKLMLSLQRDHPMSIMDTMVYMHKKEYEVRDISTLLETKRYHSSLEDVKKFLVHTVT